MNKSQVVAQLQSSGGADVDIIEIRNNGDSKQGVQQGHGGGVTND